MITIPILDAFDSEAKIGSLTIDETKIRSVDTILSLGYRLSEKDGATFIEARCFGLIDAHNHPACLRARDGIDVAGEL